MGIVWQVFSKKRSADDLIRAGKFQDALSTLEQNLKSEKQKDPLNPHKVSLLIGQIADVYLKCDDKIRAAAYFMELAEFFDQRGFYKKAVATYKKVLRLEPGNPTVLEKIADFNRRVPKYMVNTQMAQDMIVRSKDIREGNIPEPPSRR